MKRKGRSGGTIENYRDHLGRVLYPTQSQDWLFPADSDSGHLVEHKEDRRTLAKWGNDLRQTYRTVAQAASIAELDIHLLMNHAIPGVNAGYITRSKLVNDHVRQQQEMISRTVTDGIREQRGHGETAIASWPLLPARKVVADVMRRSRSTERAYSHSGAKKSCISFTCYSGR